MPPKAVKTVRDLIYWQYSKLISESAGYGKKNYRFIMDRYKKLRNGEINWSGSTREYIKELERKNECIYCGSHEPLSIDHLIPKNRGGPDIGDNAVLACKTCNSSKSDKGLYEWFGVEKRDKLPRIVEGKYLKLLYELHERNETLNKGVDTIQELCDICEVGYLCDETKFTAYCLESVLKKGLKP